MAAFNFNSEPVKYLVVALTSPFWWPFVKALYEEFNDALREEGGLFGDKPNAQELERIRRAEHLEDSLVNEPKVDAFGRPRPAPQALPAPSAAAAAPRAGGARPAGAGPRGSGGERAATGFGRRPSGTGPAPGGTAAPGGFGSRPKPKGFR